MSRLRRWWQRWVEGGWVKVATWDQLLAAVANGETHVLATRTLIVPQGGPSIILTGITIHGGRGVTPILLAG